ncbi:Uncharacterized N-terminal domain of lipid-A-disaccharide synthase [Formosa sp. Hel1_31_208]|uniref:lipid-A-disaccharide synthase N-terminal domain-containing protein n=1 Tax=Formosa sp. Hel1_31_208 TaxID=1798225 RepID=UPI00087A16D2|nr:lipid-A-disaccharide synthase N-terminal domain-containing protein [Formosa sp. Hel1_31_208]SDS70512.1 Uncharacterized N-terminal domain of lipid-A-disaccharide synthase [Formosa sp. Hel1_31_208]
MNCWIIYSIGFLAQLLFSSRLIIQWIISEKQRRVITPTLFWSLSLIASILLFIYGYLRNDFAIMFGQFLTYYIYIRNLQLQRKWQQLSKPIRWFIIVFPLVLSCYYSITYNIDFDQFFNTHDIPFWLLTLGIISQLIFTFRFVYQWLYSERQKISVLPYGFWFISLIGALLILIYALFRLDWVLLIGHTFGTLIYLRNIYLLKQQDLKNKTD